MAKVQSLPITNYSTSISGFRLGWYNDFLATASAPEPNGIEYVYTVRVKQWKLIQDTSITTTNGCMNCEYYEPHSYSVFPSINVIHDMAAARPGRTWLVGNEMERRDWGNGSQDEILPELYARAYHDVYFTIKDADPTAQVAIGGMIQATPLRLEYLDRVWNGYTSTYTLTMPVDIWNIHGFVLQEKSCRYYPLIDCTGADIPAGLNYTTGVTYTDLYAAHINFSIVQGNIQALRLWMKNHGQQNKPLYVTEYGVLFPNYFTPQQIRDSFMVPSFTYFRTYTDTNLGYPADGYRLVQRWNWYSLDDDSSSSPGNQNYAGNLIYSGLSIPQGSGNPQGVTTLGTYWQTYVQSLGSESMKPY